MGTVLIDEEVKYFGNSILVGHLSAIRALETECGCSGSGSHSDRISLDRDWTGLDGAGMGSQEWTYPISLAIPEARNLIQNQARVCLV